MEITSLKDKVIVITGAGGVLCSCFARNLAMAGAKVALLDIDYVAIEKLAQEISELGYQAKGYQCNVLDRDNLQRVKEKIHDELGTCDILINGAGGNNARATCDDEYYDEKNSDLKTFFDLELEGVEFVFSLNFMGAFLPSQVFAKDMINKTGASILNISSMNAYTPLTKIPAYSGAKAAISNFTQWLAVYFSKVGIRCNAIAPGFFSTQQNASLLWNEDGTPTMRTKKILEATPMNRFGKKEDLVGTLFYLLDNQMSGFVTGVVIPVDGGFSAYSGV